MKTRTFFLLSAMVILLGTLVYSCKNEDKHPEEGQKDVTIGDRDKTDTEYLTDIESYRVEADAEFAANDSILADFREQLKEEKDENKRREREEHYSDLERRNNEMRAKLRDYKAENRERWEEFKEEFKHDMRELGDAFRDLGVNNK
jgi:uncharacterized protein YPO0396